MGQKSGQKGVKSGHFGVILDTGLDPLFTVPFCYFHFLAFLGLKHFGTFQKLAGPEKTWFVDTFLHFFLFTFFEKGSAF